MIDIVAMIAARDLIIDQQNQRIKLLHYNSTELTEVVAAMHKLAKDKQVDKLIVYSKKQDVSQLLALGFQQEGRIDGFFSGENAHMFSCFLSSQRAVSKSWQLAEDILALSLQKAQEVQSKSLLDEYKIRPATEADAKELANLYGLVFSTYPTPINHAPYVHQTMQEGTYYVVVEYDGQIVCAASAEISRRFGSAELTDCVTHPNHLGKGLLQPLFGSLEQYIEKNAVYYLYTLTRAQSAGMNITAAKQGYLYRGRLVNNCRIFSGFEDMNIWVKPLGETWE